MPATNGAPSSTYNAAVTAKDTPSHSTLCTRFLLSTTMVLAERMSNETMSVAIMPAPFPWEAPAWP